MARSASSRSGVSRAERSRFGLRLLVSAGFGPAIRALLAAGVADALQLVAAQPLGRPSRCGQDPIAEQGQGAFGLGGEAPTLL